MAFVHVYMDISNRNSITFEAYCILISIFSFISFIKKYYSFFNGLHWKPGKIDIHILIAVYFKECLHVCFGKFS